VFGYIAATAACAISLGLVIISVTLLAVVGLQPQGVASRSIALYLLFGGTFGGIVLAAAAAWWLLEPIQSTYRRGGLALVCGFATVLVMLICMPVHQLFGRAGLLALLMISAAAAALFAVRARHLGRVQ
jgi:hypothetical protein